MSTIVSRKAALYLRQSEDVSEGIDRQRERCTALAAAKGWEVVSTYVDNDTSASKVRGPGTGWFEMLADARAGAFDVVVAVDLDRALRSIIDLGALIESGAKLVTVDGEIDLSTADGEFRATMLAAIARFEVRRKSERQKRANDFRVSKGLPVPGGRRRFGFEADHLTLREVEAEWVRTLYRRTTEGASLGSLSRELNDAGVPCVTKGKWNPARVRKLLVNPAYVGEVIHHGRAHASTEVPAVVDRDLFDRVQRIMADPTRRKHQTTVRLALMGGLGHCGSCGAPLVSAGTKTRGQMVGTYACSAVKQGQTGAIGHPSIRRTILDAVVREAVVSAFVMGKPSDFAGSQGTGLEAVERELADLGRRRTNLLQLVSADAGVSMSEIQRELSSITKGIDEAAARKAEFVAASAHAQMLADQRRDLFAGPQVSFKDAAALADALGERFDSLDLDAQRALVRDLLDVRVLPGRGSERVHIRHLVVESLNDEDEGDLGPNL